MNKNEETRSEMTVVPHTQAREAEVTYVPDVDIREDGETLSLTANMPGVDQNSVEVTVANNVLTIEGHAHVDGPEGYKLVGQEYGLGQFRRDFTLSNDVDPAGIKARMSYGVLELTLPKRETVKTRKIKITG